MAETTVSMLHLADNEATTSSSTTRKDGFIILTFIIGSLTEVMLSGFGFGWLANLIVYLITEYNVERINATQISNFVQGFINLLPIVGATLADSIWGTFPVVAISSFISTLVPLHLSLWKALAGHLVSPPV
ncbi:hypothetical protein V6N11_043746 [Hibiscus sabdariffa]|uniref:Uncharacterized protein n=1 Tax=Hibiscus sabdariffa TaxID=183260 RepID=A0ABR2RDE2_9ROSI